MPDAKDIDFIIKWERITQKSALEYTKVFLDCWSQRAEESEKKSEKLKEPMLMEGLNSAEWDQMDMILTKITETTM